MKMTQIKKVILSTLGLLLIAMGCDTDSLHKLNVDPQAVNEINMNFLFTETELSIASAGAGGDNRFIDWRTGILWCSGVIQQLATTTGGQYGCGDKYFDNQEVYYAPWRFWYSDVLKNATEVLKQTGEGGFEEGRRKNTREAQRIIRAFTYFRLTDFYGNIPFTDSNLGTSGEFFPTYDKQSDIYPALLAELDDAASKISSSNADDGFAAADMIFDGDIAKWKKWAYSLMLRYAMRVSNVDPGMANTYVQKAVAGGLMTSNDDNVWIPMADGPSEWTNQNGISRAFYPGDGGVTSEQFISATLMDFLKGSNAADTTDDDPRLMILSGGIGDWTTIGVALQPGGEKAINQRGMPNGHDSQELEDLLGLPNDYINRHTFSMVNYKMLYDAAPYQIMNTAEVEFLLAEACERGIGGLSAGDAKSHYDKGVRLAMQMYTPFDASLSVSDAQVDAYLAKYPYGGGGVQGGQSKLEQIGWQLWVSHFFNWYEAWNDWRRTGFPTLTPTDYPNNLTNGVIPRRLRYPNDEVAGNSDNYKAGATLPDNLLTKVWWDGGQ
jgi:hypothetical protein